MLKTLGEKVLLRKVEREKLSPGGIALPDNWQEHRPNRGSVLCTVVAVGDKAAAYVKPEQVVYAPDFGGVDIKHEGRDYIVFNVEDIVAVVR